MKLLDFNISYLEGNYSVLKGEGQQIRISLSFIFIYIYLISYDVKRIDRLFEFRKSGYLKAPILYLELIK